MGFSVAHNFNEWLRIERANIHWYCKNNQPFGNRYRFLSTSTEYFASILILTKKGLNKIKKKKDFPAHYRCLVFFKCLNIKTFNWFGKLYYCLCGFLLKVWSSDLPQPPACLERPKLKLHPAGRGSDWRQKERVNNRRLCKNNTQKRGLSENAIWRSLLDEPNGTSEKIHDPKTNDRAERFAE